jgi:hypothetical protein
MLTDSSQNNIVLTAFRIKDCWPESLDLVVDLARWVDPAVLVQHGVIKLAFALLDTGDIKMGLGMLVNYLRQGGSGNRGIWEIVISRLETGYFSWVNDLVFAVGLPETGEFRQRLLLLNRLLNQPDHLLNNFCRRFGSWVENSPSELEPYIGVIAQHLLNVFQTMGNCESGANLINIAIDLLESRSGYLSFDPVAHLFHGFPLSSDTALSFLAQSLAGTNRFRNGRPSILLKSLAIEMFRIFADQFGTVASSTCCALSELIDQMSGPEPRVDHELLERLVGQLLRILVNAAIAGAKEASAALCHLILWTGLHPSLKPVCFESIVNLVHSCISELLLLAATHWPHEIERPFVVWLVMIERLTTSRCDGRAAVLARLSVIRAMAMGSETTVHSVVLAIPIGSTDAMRSALVAAWTPPPPRPRACRSTHR